MPPMIVIPTKLVALLKLFIATPPSQPSNTFFSKFGVPAMFPCQVLEVRLSAAEHIESLQEPQ